MAELVTQEKVQEFGQYLSQTFPEVQKYTYESLLKIWIETDNKFPYYVTVFNFNTCQTTPKQDNINYEDDSEPVVLSQEVRNDPIKLLRALFGDKYDKQD